MMAPFYLPRRSSTWNAVDILSSYCDELHFKHFQWVCIPLYRALKIDQAIMLPSTSHSIAGGRSPAGMSVGVKVIFQKCSKGSLAAILWKLDQGNGCFGPGLVGRKGAFRGVSVHTPHTSSPPPMLQTAAVP